MASRGTARQVVLGIDPGTAILGYGVVAEGEPDHTALAYGVLTTQAGEAQELRLKCLYDGLVQLIAMYRPTSCAIEELFFRRNVSTAISVGQARGVALLAAAQAGIPVGEYTPMEVKQAVAMWGHAKKDQVQLTVQMLLRLPEPPKPDDAADALAIAICHIHHSHSQALVDETLRRQNP